MNSCVTRVEGKAIPVPGNDIDTDRVIPARFMKCVTFAGLGQYAFYDVRYDADGNTIGHPFDDPRFAGGSVLLVNKNFGCGSSREHAPQALQKYGINGIIGESFAEIFAGNCTVMGIPAVTVSEADIASLMAAVEASPETPVLLDLDGMQARCGELTVPVAMPDTYRSSLVKGTWDSTSLLLSNEAEIRETAARLPYVDA